MKSLLYRLQSTLAQYHWLLPPDIHERHRYIASHVPPGSTVLDVGGEQRFLDGKVPLTEYYTINIDPEVAGVHTHHKTSTKDLVYDGTHLPFTAGEFDVLLCIDVLEHVPKAHRLALIKEMLRVTRKKLILSAPYGSVAHLAKEQQLAEELEQAGHRVPFLWEHVQIGLPTPQEITTWQKKLRATKVIYSGNFYWSAWLLKLQLAESRVAIFNHLLFFCKCMVYGLANVFIYPVLFSEQPTTVANRFYMVFEVKPSASSQAHN